MTACNFSALATGDSGSLIPQTNRKFGSPYFPHLLLRDTAETSAVGGLHAFDRVGRPQA